LRISEEILGGESRAEYGAEIVKKLSKFLTGRYGKGFTKSNLLKSQNKPAVEQELQQLTNNSTGNDYIYHITLRFANEDNTYQVTLKTTQKRAAIQLPPEYADKTALFSRPILIFILFGHLTHNTAGITDCFSIPQFTRIAICSLFVRNFFSRICFRKRRFISH